MTKEMRFFVVEINGHIVNGSGEEADIQQEHSVEGAKKSALAYCEGKGESMFVYELVPRFKGVNKTSVSWEKIR